MPPTSSASSSAVPSSFRRREAATANGGSSSPRRGGSPAAVPSPRSGGGGGAWREFVFCCDSRAVVAGSVLVDGDGGGGGGESQQRHGHPPSRDLDSAEQRELAGLSPAGLAALKALRLKHFWHHKRQWNVSSGRVVAVHSTPRVETRVEGEGGKDGESGSDGAGGAAGGRADAPPPPAAMPLGGLPLGHSDWFPRRLGEIVSETEEWCDVLNLGPPDGLFMDAFASAICRLHEKNRPIVVRMMFGNVLGIGNVNCSAVVAKLTAGIRNPESTKLRLWVGAWRKGVSWNHAKILVSDGNVLVTGGHNLWDEHYLRRNPVLDLSMELEGPVAEDAHLYANEQWEFVEKLTTSSFGKAANRIQSSKYAPVVFKSFVTLKRFPPSVPRHPPNYVRQLRAQLFRRLPQRPGPANVPVVAMGRCGAITPLNRRPSDDAIVAMLESARRSVRLALQDLGPVCIPGTKITLPGCIWPRGYLNALGRVLWTTRAQIEILLSNPLSVPGDLTMMQAVYGNGWTCIDVAAEIIKTVVRQYPIAAKINPAKLRDKVATQIRVSYLRGPDGASAWPDSKTPNGTRAFHAKHFIVDDRTFYIGSQNLYISDLAEWGVVVDNADATQQVLNEFWNPLWKQSYRAEDCNVQEVMDGLRIGRNGESPIFMSASTRKLLHESVQTRQSAISSKASAIIAASRVMHALQAESADEDVEVLAPASRVETTPPESPEKRVSKEGDATRRFRALGHIAVLAQSQPPVGANNHDLYYADDEEAKLRVDDDEGPAPADIESASPLAKITALKYLTRHRMRRNSV